MDTIKDGYTVTSRRGHVEVSGLNVAEVQRALDMFAGTRMSEKETAETIRDSIVASAVTTGQGHLSQERQASAERAAQHRLTLLGTPTYTYRALAEIRGVHQTAVRSWVSRNSAQVLAPHVRGRVVLPAFQFSDAGEVRARVAEVNQILDREGAMDDWSRWGWWHARTSFLSGQSPISIIDDEPDRIQTAAERTARLNAA